MAEFIPPEVKKSEKNWTPPEVKDGKPYIPEPGLEPVGLLESFITPVKAYGLSLPAIKAVEKFGSPMASEIAGKLLPKTAGQLAGGAATAGAAGVAGELAERKAPEGYKTPARVLAELGTGAVTGLTGKVGRGATPAIPQERIESARYLKDIGGKPSYEQISRGAEATSTARRLTRQQGVSNEQYNEALGLPKKSSFGKKEFSQAEFQIGNDYNRLLEGRKVFLDDDFFARFQDLLAKQQKLESSGITFGQSRAILSALDKIGAVPRNLQAKLNSLPRIGEEEATAKQSAQALQLLNEIFPSLRNKPRIEMDATAYNEIRSILGDAAYRTANNRNASLLRKIQGEFDRVADKSMPDIVPDLERTRRRYEALKTLEEAQLASGVEMGVIPAEAVGKAIRNRIEQGAIYGNNNPLRQIGEAGISLGITAPATGRRFSQDFERGLTPRSTLWGVIRDLGNIPIYPIRSYSGARRLEEIPSMGAAIPPTASAVSTEPNRKK